MIRRPFKWRPTGGWVWPEVAQLRAEVARARATPPVIGEELYQDHVALMRLIRDEPEWAASRLREAERVRRELLTAPAPAPTTLEDMP